MQLICIGIVVEQTLPQGKNWKSKQKKHTDTPMNRWMDGLIRRGQRTNVTVSEGNIYIRTALHRFFILCAVILHARALQIEQNTSSTLDGHLLSKGFA